MIYYWQDKDLHREDARHQILLGVGRQAYAIQHQRRGITAALNAWDQASIAMGGRAGDEESDRALDCIMGIFQ